MDITLLIGEKMFEEFPGQRKKFEVLREEKIISVLNSINNEVNEVIREVQHNDIQNSYLKSRIKHIRIKLKHLKRLVG